MRYELNTGWEFAVVDSHAQNGSADPVDFKKLTFLPATVPGCAELDLFAAGCGKDPYFGQNPYDYRYLEGKDFVYRIEFEADSDMDRLRFAGIDTIADIFLNGERIGHTENQFLEYEFSVSLRAGKNELAVCIYSPVLWARRYDVPAFCNAQPFHFETLSVRKVASMYGWDILPRFVSGGIFRPVTLEKKADAALTTAGLFTLGIPDDHRRATLRLAWGFETADALLDGYRIRITGVCGDRSFEKEADATFTAGVMTLELNDPLLWYPRGYGEQPLYHVTVTLLKNDRILDAKTFDFGIRTVELVRTSATDAEGTGEFCFRVNGKKIFILGTNWVPLDAFPCRYAERLPAALRELDDIGCNAVRIWGGGIYESDAFYDFCDRKGILVWQDFCMGCATYPNDAHMENALREEATFIVRKLRNHPSLALWAGDNECDEAAKWNRYNPDPNRNTLTRKILPDVIRQEDFTRPYLPSSPYTDSDAFRTHGCLPEDHLWGPRDCFRGDYYRTSPAHFASEIGYHGCPSPKSLEQFISPENLYPFLSADGTANEDWLCHASGVVRGMKGPYAYRIPLMKNQVVTMFGETVPDRLSDFAKASQISQAEALKFFIEHFRVAKWRRTGIIWWNLLDGWPQISDAVIDWYHCKKLAYHFIKRAQIPFTLAFDEPEDGFNRLVAINDTGRDIAFAFEVTEPASGAVILQGNAIVPAHSAVTVDRMAEMTDYHFLLLSAKSETSEVRSHYITKVRDLSYPQYLRDLEQSGMAEFEGF